MIKKFFADIKVGNKMALVALVSILFVWIGLVLVAVHSIYHMYSRKTDRIVEQTAKLTSKYVNTEYTNIINLAHYSAVGDEMQMALRLDVSRSNQNYIAAQSMIGPILTQLQFQNEFIDSAQVLIKGRWFYDDNSATTGLVQPELDAMVDEAEGRLLIYWSEKSIYNPGTGHQVMPIIMRVPNGSMSSKDEAYMVVNINVNKMFSYLKELEHSTGCSLVIHNGEHVIFGDEALFAKMEGPKYIIRETGIHINDWMLSCVMDRAGMFAELYRTVLQMLAISLLIAIFCVLMAVWVGRSVTRPLGKLMEQVQLFESGDFGARSTLYGKDEIGQLGNSFNSMCDQIAEDIRMLEAEKEQVKRVEENIRKEEMKVLQAQINPHFLYNALDSLYWYSLSGRQAEIGQIVVDLSQMLRIGLSKGSEEITVEQELKHVENYLRIQKVIFNDKFDFELEHDEAILPYRIVKILLQPLAENSLVHGFADMEKGGRIKISARVEGGEGVFSVEDNGCGFERAAKNAPTKFSGYALKNINKRIALHYNEGATLKIESVPYEKTRVEIRIALEMMGERDV
ncbi:MAG: histidine kinase [Lachnospiraceae bacterium]|nr:histidine kinase [Lachnospiraceae bacterium]